MLPCEVAGAGEGRGSDDTYDISRYGHTACLIEGCSQIVVFGGMRCGSLSSGGGGCGSNVAVCDDTPHELNDLLLFDPDMLKWCALVSLPNQQCCRFQPLPFTYIHQPVAVSFHNDFQHRIRVPPSFGPSPPHRAFHAAVSAGSSMVDLPPILHFYLFISRSQTVCDM